MPKKRILFIVNPISGHRDKSQFREKAAGALNGADFSYETVFTEHAGHAQEEPPVDGAGVDALDVALCQEMQRLVGA